MANPLNQVAQWYQEQMNKVAKPKKPAVEENSVAEMPPAEGDGEPKKKNKVVGSIVKATGGQ